MEVKRGGNAQLVQNALFKHTSLQTRFSCNMVALVNGTPRTLTLKDFLQHFLDFRCVAGVVHVCVWLALSYFCCHFVVAVVCCHFVVVVVCCHFAVAVVCCGFCWSSSSLLFCCHFVVAVILWLLAFCGCCCFAVAVWEQTGSSTQCTSNRSIVVIRRGEHDLAKARTRLHLVQGLLVVFDDLDRVLSAIRKASSTADAAAVLQERFGLSKEQSAGVLSMSLGRLTGLEEEKLKTEQKELEARCV